MESEGEDPEGAVALDPGDGAGLDRMMVDRAGKILFINRAWQPAGDVWKWSAAAATTSCRSRSHHRVEVALDRVFTQRMLDEYEVRSAPTPDGEWRWYCGAPPAR